MTGLPLRYVHENILVGHGDARAALFRVGTVSYPFLSVADKREWLRRLARLAFALEADVSLWRVNRAYPAQDYVAQAAGMLDARRQDAAGVAVVPGRARGAPAPFAVVRAGGVCGGVVARRAAGSTVGGGMLRGVDRARRRLEALFGVAGVPPIAVARAGGADRRGGARVPPRGGLSAGAARETREVQWLLRRAACRGLGEPALDPHWQPAALVVETADGRLAYEPLECDLVRHANAPILEHDRTLVVDAPEGRSFQAMLALGALPEEAEFPGSAELLFGPLEAVSSRSTACCTRAGSATGTRSRESAGGSSTPTSRSPSSWLRARAAVVCGGGEPAAGARARRLSAVARAAAAA